MTDEEFIKNFEHNTATEEEHLKLINILLNMPDEENNNDN